MKSEALKMDDITKIYPNGVIANDGISLMVHHGEIHALSGENGAGKSTLMKILFGEENPTSGKIYIDGKKAKIDNPSDALKLGIGMVHQHFMLVPSLSVLDNIILGEEPKNFLFTDYKKAKKEVLSLMNKFNMKINPDSLVKDLSVGQKQKLEILKILMRGAKILILDEPTAVLTPQETKELFVELKLLRDEHYTIIFISHKLNEVRELCSDITIIRRGKYKGSFSMSEISDDEISNLMVGRSVSSLIKKPVKHLGNSCLDITDLIIKDKDGVNVIDNINFSIKSGEILGIAGVEGNGQSQLVESITGSRNISSGKIKFNEIELPYGDIKKIRKLKISYIPEDRMTVGMAGNLSITENIIADKVDTNKFINKFGMLKLKSMKNYSNLLAKKYEILCKSTDIAVKSLSGGNIQKVVLARELDNSPELIIADQPTRGVDVGSSEYIREQLAKLSSEGCAILVVSSDLTELLAISDKIIVLADGKLTACINDCENTSEEDLGKYMLGVSKMSDDEIKRKCYENQRN